MAKLKDEVGNKHYRLLVVSQAPNRVTPSGRQRVYWNCICDCGSEIEVLGENLRTGFTRSCGCLNAENHHKHGCSQENVDIWPVYNAWRAMKNRCYWEGNVLYHRYGGRGITVCDRWLESFESFLADMGPKPSEYHSLDRVDNDGNYEPENCRWATRREQALNREDKLTVCIDGEEKSLMLWCEEYGINYKTANERIRSGWDPESAVKTPVKIRTKPSY